MKALAPHRHPGRLLAALLLLLATLSPALAAEEILLFDSTVEVAEDGALTVTERITVRAEGRRIRRGIYRDFPLLFRRGDGGIGRVGFKVLRVLRNGAPENWFSEQREGGFIRIYAGRKEVLLPPGEYTYTFVYRTTRQLRFFPDHDELFWNVTGERWRFPIRKARITARLPQMPDGRAARIDRVALFTGPPGSRASDAVIVRRSDGVVVAETTRALLPGEGFSIAIAFPKGVVRAPGWLQQLWWRAQDSLPLWWVIGGAALVNLYFLWAWWRVGRDPKPGVIIPRWQPPEGISPAAAAWLRGEAGLRGGDAGRMFSAALVSLAVKGFLRIEPQEEEEGRPHTRLVKLKEPDASLPPGEQALMDTLFEDGRDSLAFSGDNGQRLHQALATFTRAIEQEHAGRHVEHNRLWFMLGTGLLVVLGAGLLVMAVWGLPRAMPILALAMFTIIPAIMLGHLLRDALSGGKGWKLLPPMLFSALFLAVALTMTLQMLRASMPGAQAVMVLLAVASLPLGLMLWGYLLRRPTPSGRALLDEIEGVRMFIETAEQERFNRAGGPKQAVTLFEKLLPWAIALDLEKPWTRAFSAWLASAAAAGTAAAVAYQPGWHGGHIGRVEEIGTIGERMTQALDGAMPSQSASGFGGGAGGGVGGGGGGGGGGGW